MAPMSALQFRRVVKAKRKIDPTKMRAQPSVVARDLRRGCIETLTDYLATHQGIPHPEVALALLTLLTGSAKQTDHRLAVVRHPDLPSRTKTKTLTRGITRSRPRQMKQLGRLWA